MISLKVTCCYAELPVKADVSFLNRCNERFIVTRRVCPSYTEGSCLVLKDGEVQRIEAYTSERSLGISVFVQNSALCWLFHPVDTAKRAAITS